MAYVNCNVRLPREMVSARSRSPFARYGYNLRMDIRVPLVCLPLGIGFIALGRFLYGRPSRLSPDWVHADPNSKTRAAMTNVYSVMMICIGGAAIGMAIGAFLPASVGGLTLLLELAGGILSGVYLRPKGSLRH